MLSQFLGSFKKYFLKLYLKVLRFLIGLSVSGVLFQKVGPIYGKASWLVLKTILKTKYIKDYIQIIRALFIEILENDCINTLFESISHR